MPPGLGILSGAIRFDTLYFTKTLIRGQALLRAAAQPVGSLAHLHAAARAFFLR